MKRDVRWMNEWDLSEAKAMATDNRFQNHTKSLTFNLKIYYRDNAEDRNKLMKSKIRRVYLLIKFKNITNIYTE